MVDLSPQKSTGRPVGLFGKQCEWEWEWEGEQQTEKNKTNK